MQRNKQALNLSSIPNPSSMKKVMAAAAAIIFMTSLLASGAQAKTLRETQNALWAGTPPVFSDIPVGHVNYNAIAMLSEDEVIAGYADGTFKPNGNINRAELTKMVVAGMVEGEDLSSYKNCFPDVHAEWFAPYICYAKSQGWVSGYPDGTFKPANPVNRVEGIKIVFNVMIPSSPVDYWPSPTEAERQLPLPKDAPKGQWYEGYLTFAIAKELLDGQHVTGDANAFYFKPGDPMTRKEVAEMMYRIWLYMTERVEYVQVIQMAACLQLENASKTDDEVRALFVQDLEEIDMTEEDADLLEMKYGMDTVMQEMLLDAVKSQCAGAPDAITKWTFILTKYAR